MTADGGQPLIERNPIADVEVRGEHDVKGVAVAGGWTDFNTMMRCCDIPEDADVLVT